MTSPAPEPGTGSLADEDGVRRIVTDTLFGEQAVAVIREHHARWPADRDDAG
jgi:hypothetical protein